MNQHCDCACRALPLDGIIWFSSDTSSFMIDAEEIEDGPHNTGIVIYTENARHNFCMRDVCKQGLKNVGNGAVPLARQSPCTLTFSAEQMRPSQWPHKRRASLE